MRLHPLTWCVAATMVGTFLGVNLLRCSFDGQRIVYGWPLTHKWVTLRITFDRASIPLNGEKESEVIVRKGETIEESQWDDTAMAANAALGALITICAAILCECLLRGLRFIRTVRYEKSLHSLTWWVVALVLSGHIALNWPRGEVRHEQTFGWPLIYKQVFPTPTGNGNTSILVTDPDKREPTVFISTTELTTLRDYPALLTDFLIAVLTAATAGILSQRVLSRSATAANQLSKAVN